MSFENAFLPDEMDEDDMNINEMANDGFTDMSVEDESNSPVSRVFCNVLEEMGFMFAESIKTEELPDEPADLTSATISFEGESSGKLELLVEKNLARELAAGLLGIDMDDPAADEDSSDALGELMNVTLGQLLTTLYGKEPVFSLQPPDVKSEVSSEFWHTLKSDEDATAYLIDDSPAMMIYRKVA